MARVLFISAPLPGHIDWGGMHRTAVALQARGHRVLWVTEAAGTRYLASWGIPTRVVPESGWLWPPPPMPQGLSLQERARERERRAVAVWLEPKRVIPATQAFEAVIQEWQPDVIVAEPFMAGAAFAAERASLPLIITGWPATQMPERVPPHQAEAARLAQKWFRTLCERLSVRAQYWAPGPLPWLRSPYLHLVYFIPEWYATWKVLSPPTVFVGGQVSEPQGPPPPWLPFYLEGEGPRVFITLGGTFTQDESFFLRAVEAALHVGARVLVATGNATVAERLRMHVPGEVIVQPWVPFEHVFPHVDVIVHHGGMGTTHSALIYGIPQIVVPHAADQYYQAARVHRLGLGLSFRVHEATETTLRAGVRALLSEERWKQRAREIASAMASLGGIARAADEVERVVHTATTGARQ